MPNPNSQGGEVPSLLHASQDYTKDEVIAIIRNGRILTIVAQDGAAAVRGSALASGAVIKTIRTGLHFDIMASRSTTSRR